MRRTPRITAPVAGLAALIGAFWFFPSAVDLFSERPIEGAEAIPWWFSLFGDTLGQMISYQSLTYSLMSFVLSPVLVLVFGYWIGQRLDITREYRRLLRELTVGGALGLLAGRTLAAAALVATVGDDQLLVIAIEAAVSGVNELLALVIAGVAGAAIGSARRSTRRSAVSESTDTSLGERRSTNPVDGQSNSPVER